MGKIRHLFAGSNSGKGFYSLFDNIIGPEARRVYLLKGGPGTGKSRLMSHIAGALAEEGIDQERFFCSSDSKALDAVSFPTLGIAMIDATAPHALEATWPGCRDHLVNLGHFWSTKMLEAKRDEIMRGGRIKQGHFAASFRYFAAALAVEENIACRQETGQRSFDCSWELEEIFALLSSSTASAGDRTDTIRRLFASALTPEGYVSHIQSLSADMTHLFILTGGMGTAQNALLGRIASYAQGRGYDLEAFHYPLNPKRLLHLFIPEAGVGVLSEIPLEDLGKLKGRRIACGPVVTSADGGDLRLYQELLQRGFDSLVEAQSSHHFVEEIYTQAMDFDSLNTCRDQILAEILS